MSDDKNLVIRITSLCQAMLENATHGAGIGMSEIADKAWDDAMEKASELALALRYLPNRPTSIAVASDIAELIENTLEVEWGKMKNGKKEETECQTES
jgi:hypothetical protein